MGPDARDDLFLAGRKTRQRGRRGGRSRDRGFVPGIEHACVHMLGRGNRGGRARLGLLRMSRGSALVDGRNRLGRRKERLRDLERRRRWWVAQGRRRPICRRRRRARRGRGQRVVAKRNEGRGGMRVVGPVSGRWCRPRRHRGAHGRRRLRSGRWLRRHPVAQLGSGASELERAVVVRGLPGGLRGATQPNDGVDAFATLPQCLGGLEAPDDILGVGVFGVGDRNHRAGVEDSRPTSLTAKAS